MTNCGGEPANIQMGYLITKKFVSRFKWRSKSERHPLYWTHRHGVLGIILIAENPYEAQARAIEIVASLPFEIVGGCVTVEVDNEANSKALQSCGRMFENPSLEGLAPAFAEESLRLMGFAWWLIGVPYSEETAEDSDVEEWPD